MCNVKKDYIVGGLLFLLTAVFFIIPSFGLEIIKTVLGETSLGAGFFPLLLGVIVAICGITLIAEGVFSKTNTAAAEEISLSREEKRQNTRMVILSILIILAALLIWKVVGFYLMLVIFCFAMNYIFGGKLLFNAVMTTGLVGFVYAAFTLGLKIRFQA